MKQWVQWKVSEDFFSWLTWFAMNVPLEYVFLTPPTWRFLNSYMFIHWFHSSIHRCESRWRNTQKVF